METTRPTNDYRCFQCGAHDQTLTSADEICNVCIDADVNGRVEYEEEDRKYSEWFGILLFGEGER